MWAWKPWIMTCVILSSLVMCVAVQRGFSVVGTGLGGLVIFLVLVFTPKFMRF